jgi:hypothetical protein
MRVAIPAGTRAAAGKYHLIKYNPDHFGRGFLLVIKPATKFSEIAEPV